MKFILYRLVVLCCIFAIISNPAKAHIKKIEIKVGEKAPDFTVNDPEGKSISLSSLRGKIVLLDFWASWCMPCRMANPELVTLYNNYSKLGFDIFSVSLDGKKEPWKNAIKNDKLAWPNHGSELKGWESKVCDMYGVEQIPTGFLIDEDGIILGKDLDDYEVEKKLKYLFFEKVNVYPKLASLKIFFTGKTKYEIENASGVVILKGKGEDVDITGLNLGEYTIKYDNNKTEKFIKRYMNQPFVTFYPTNVTDNITMSREAEYEVLNTRGKVLMKGTKAAIDIPSDLPSGVYYLNIEGEIHRFLKR